MYTYIGLKSVYLSVLEENYDSIRAKEELRKICESDALVYKPGRRLFARKPDQPINRCCGRNNTLPHLTFLSDRPNLHVLIPARKTTT